MGKHLGIEGGKGEESLANIFVCYFICLNSVHMYFNSSGVGVGTAL